MQGRVWRSWMAWLLVPAALAGQEPPGRGDATVNAVLFYSPTCPHCREVMTETLPPVLERYGPRLKIVTVNTTTAGGEQLFRAAIQSLPIPEERIGVPTLVVGSRALVGAYEIPNLLPGIVDTALVHDGIDWPPVPLIRRALAAQGIDTATTSVRPVRTGEAAPAEEVAPAEEAGPAAEAAPAGDTVAAEAPVAEEAPEPGDATAGNPAVRDPAAGADRVVAGDPDGAVDRDAREGAGAAGAPAAEAALDSVLAGAIDPDARAALVHDLPVRDRLMLDPAGNGLAIAVLIFMLVVLALVAADLADRIRIPLPPRWAIPVLGAVGLGVAAYLAFVEATGAAAVCGPVGDCNTVQQSPYATLLGVPVGLLGVLGYAGLLATWVVGRLGTGRRARLARQTTWWLALVATGFSLYLTFLEPFVIGASCAWCLTSAVVSTLILAAATPERRGVSGVGVSPTARPSVSH